VRIIDKGTGPPLVIVPGLQGRWDYIAPAVEALARTFRVMTFDLCDEPSSGAAFLGERGLDNYVVQLGGVLDRCGVERAHVCGISFGGLIALRVAATHPERVASLILASTPGPGWHLRRRHELYARLPRLFGPIFLAETPFRLRLELRAALPARRDRRAFARSQLRLLVGAPLSLARMAARARLISRADIASDCARVTAPTLVVTGERDLDHVVPVDGSVGYLSAICGSRGVVLERSGHLGSITRPEAFAAIIRKFAAPLAREVA
jgi:pimeloyl-ACP methyl ester carboxylesterase